MRSSTLAKKIAELALTRKANDVVTMDLRGLTSMADYFVVCSADSDIQVKAIAEAVEEGLELQGTSPWHRESTSSNWFLLDYVDVVLHIFHKNTRPFYNLEKLWGDAKIETIRDKDRPAVKRAARTRSKSPKSTPRRKTAS